MADANTKRNDQHRHARSWKSRVRAKGATVVEYIVRQDFIDLTDGRCGICGEYVPTADITIDHIVPIRRGGHHTWENLQVAHRLCNAAKGNRLMHEVTPKEIEALRAGKKPCPPEIEAQIAKALDLAAEGMTNRQIGKTIGRSESWVSAVLRGKLWGDCLETRKIEFYEARNGRVFVYKHPVEEAEA